MPFPYISRNLCQLVSNVLIKQYVNMQVKGNILVSFLKYFAFFLPFQLRDQNYSNNQVTYLSLSPLAKYLLPYLLWKVIPPIKRCGRITVTLVYKLHTLSPKGHPHFKYTFSSVIKISYQSEKSYLISGQ